MVHVPAPANSRKAGGRRSPLIATLVFWAFLASLACVNRSGSAATKCESAASAALSRATAAVGALGSGGSGSGAGQAADQQDSTQQQQQQQHNGDGGQQPGAGGQWPHLRDLSREQIEALIRAPAERHGRQQKGGLPANFMFVMAHLTDTNPKSREEGVPRTFGPAAFQWFAQSYTFNRTHQSNRDLQSPVPACHFWADHKYKILYVRNFKTAGTSVTVTLGQKELPMYCTYQPANCAKKCEKKQVCLENVSNPEALQKLFAEYTVFSFVRNPWARALSSWHHTHKYGLQEDCQDTFSKFAEVPSRYGAKCLAEFKCCKRRPGWLLEHIEPQATCLFDDQGEPAVDFLGRVEHLDEDMQEFVALINSKLAPGVEPLTVGKLPRWQLARQDMADKQDELWRYYSELYYNSTTALEDIRSYFHRDFDLLRIPGREGPDGAARL